jgi:hypothetical protein
VRRGCWRPRGHDTSHVVASPAVTPGKTEGRGKGVQGPQEAPRNPWTPFPSLHTAGDDGEVAAGAEEEISRPQKLVRERMAAEIVPSSR